MAGITQTISSFNQGISEQPDHLKFQGQVRNVENAIPDLTYGLFKRPGAARVGTSPLASVQSGGSWFHYYRDESEGSYVGQVDAAGQLRIWSCSTGAEMNIYNNIVTQTFTNISYTTQSGSVSGYTNPINLGTGSNATALKNAITGKVHIGSTGIKGSKVVATNITNTAGLFVNNAELEIATLTTSGTTRIGFPNNAAGPASGTSGTCTLKISLDLSPIPYLTTSDPENLQFLTINDTTFVTNRDSSNANTKVGETGSTFDRPEPHCAMLELIRTENGRQYGINIFDSTATNSLTTIKRATKLKIRADSLDVGNGTGHCPGIGTEVFSVTAASSYSSYENVDHVRVGTSSSAAVLTSNRDNLVFRITALGQQGVSPQYSYNNDAPDGQNYRCSYNLEVTLLHGGEGWEKNNTIRVIPEFAEKAADVQSNGTGSQAWIEVTVTEIEETEVKATISSNGDGLIRPSPTPFDSDTAVTADTILAGIVDQLPSGISAKVIGPGIYLSSNSPFNVEVAEEDLMRVFQKSVNDVTLLPNQCRHGYIVKVANARMSDEDDYYLQFQGENNLDGTGSWSECAVPGITDELTNMPLVIQRTAVDEFTIREFTYAKRRVGDLTTNPMPTFLGKRINKVLFFRNRLAILAGENVILSRPGSLGEPDFFIESALTVSASDPIDISAASMFPSEIFDALEINAGLLVFSTNQQFLLSTDDTVLNPDTAKLRSVATYNYNKDVPPIALGTTIAYIDNSGKYSRVNEMANTSREGEPQVVEISKLVPSLLPKNIDLLTNSRENNLILAAKANDSSSIVYGYKYFIIGEKREQQAWFKWKLNKPIKYHFIINDDYYFVDTDNFLQSIKLVQSDDDPSITQDNINYQIHLDNHTNISGGSYNATTNLTTFSSVSWMPSVTSPNHELAIIDIDSNAARIARYAKPTTTSTTSFTVPGDWSGATLKIGYLYQYLVEFPRIYPTKVSGERSFADVNSSLVLHRVKFHFGKIGLYETNLKRLGKSDYPDVYDSNQLDEYEVSDAPYLEEHIQTIPVYEKNKNVDITLKSSHPAPATLRAMAWEGDYSPRFYKRA